MSRLSQPNTALEESRPFQGMSMVNENTAGIDIGAHEIMACVRGPDHTQLAQFWQLHYRLVFHCQLAW